MLVLPLALACSGSDEAEPCDVAHRNGTYLQSFRERPGGTCGPLSDQVTVLSGLEGPGGSCVLDAPDQVSSDQCKLTRQLSCVTDGVDGSQSAVAVSTEKDSGDRIEGTFTIRVFDGGGALVCASTYDTVAVRQ
jgi:hypothetical protein